MWANAQCDGRPAEHICGALCSTPQSLADAHYLTAVREPKLTILWEHLEDILLLNRFFPIVDRCLSCEDIARQICAMMPRWRFSATFCVLYFSEPRGAHFRPAF